MEYLSRANGKWHPQPGTQLWEPWQGRDVATLDRGWKAWGEQTVGMNRWWALLRFSVLVEVAVGVLVRGAQRDVAEGNTDGGHGDKGDPCSSHLSHGEFPS